MHITFKKLSNPIMFVGDNPCLHGGLSRIGRDLSTLTATLPQFRVAYLGRGIGQKRRLPIMLYDYPEHGMWGQEYLEQAWTDFASTEPGVIMTLDDISRRGWMNNGEDKFLGRNRTFQKWMYTPVDSTGPNGVTLPMAQSRTVMGFDRVMAASEWGCNILRIGGRTDADWLPHGIHMDKFNTVGTELQERVIVGCVMANQSRKDFPAAFHCFRTLLDIYGNRFQAWLHTDVLVRHWDVYELIEDYGMSGNINVTVTLSDEELAARYRACACTILPSGGEGFGYPIAESLACGTGCVATGYAGGAELVKINHTVSPIDYRVDTIHNCRRAVNAGVLFASACQVEIEKKMEDWPTRSEEIAATVAHLDWNKLSIPWVKWLTGGLQ